MASLLFISQYSRENRERASACMLKGVWFGDQNSTKTRAIRRVPSLPPYGVPTWPYAVGEDGLFYGNTSACTALHTVSNGKIGGTRRKLVYLFVPLTGYGRSVFIVHGLAVSAPYARKIRVENGHVSDPIFPCVESTQKKND